MKKLQLKWTRDLTIAVVEEDIDKINELINNMPSIKKLNKVQEILALISQAIHLVESKKQKTLETMNKIKQTKAFLQNQ